MVFTKSEELNLLSPNSTKHGCIDVLCEFGHSSERQISLLK